MPRVPSVSAPTAPGFSLEAFLSEQRNAYLQALPGRLAQIEAQAVRVLPAGGDAAEVRALERSVHGVAGSAGSFGLGSVTDAARALELAIEAAGSGHWPEATARAIAARLDALRREMGRAMHTTGEVH